MHCGWELIDKAHSAAQEKELEWVINNSILSGAILNILGWKSEEKAIDIHHT